MSHDPEIWHHTSIRIPKTVFLRAKKTGKPLHELIRLSVERYEQAFEDVTK